MNNNDLDQISQLLDRKLEEKLTQKLAPIQSELRQHGKLLHQHGKILHQHSKLLHQHSKLLKSLKKDQDTMLTMLDKEQMDQRKRLKKVENQLGLISTAT